MSSGWPPDDRGRWPAARQPATADGSDVGGESRGEWPDDRSRGWYTYVEPPSAPWQRPAAPDPSPSWDLPAPRGSSPASWSEPTTEGFPTPREPLHDTFGRRAADPLPGYREHGRRERGAATRWSRDGGDPLGGYPDSDHHASTRPSHWPLDGEDPLAGGYRRGRDRGAGNRSDSWPEQRWGTGHPSFPDMNTGRGLGVDGGNGFAGLGTGAGRAPDTAFAPAAGYHDAEGRAGVAQYGRDGGWDDGRASGLDGDGGFGHGRVAGVGDVGDGRPPTASVGQADDLFAREFSTAEAETSQFTADPLWTGDLRSGTSPAGPFMSAPLAVPHTSPAGGSGGAVTPPDWSADEPWAAGEAAAGGSPAGWDAAGWASAAEFGAATGVLDHARNDPAHRPTGEIDAWDLDGTVLDSPPSDIGERVGRRRRPVEPLDQDPSPSPRSAVTTVTRPGRSGTGARRSASRRGRTGRAATRPVGRRRGRSGDRRLWLALGGLAAVAVAAIAVIVASALPSGPGGPAHRLVTPARVGQYLRRPALERQMNVSQLGSQFITMTAGQASHVVEAVYEEGTATTGKAPQILMFVGGNLANASPPASISSFTHRFGGATITSPGGLGGKAACVNATAAQPDSPGIAAICAWFDNDSFGELVSPTMNAASLAQTMRTVRPHLELVVTKR